MFCVDSDSDLFILQYYRRTELVSRIGWVLGLGPGLAGASKCLSHVMRVRWLNHCDQVEGLLLRPC